MNYNKFIKKLAFLCLFSLSFLLSGCFALPTEDYVSPPTIEPLLVRPLPMVAVARGDVRSVVYLEAIYVPPQVEIQRFGVAGPVMGVFVSVGSVVLEGDVIAALDLLEVREQREVLSERSAWLEFELQLINERRNLTISLAGENVATPYDTMRVEMLEELEFIENLLEYLEQMNQERYLLASKDGVITQVLSFTDTFVANPLTRIATISNEALETFVINDPLTTRMSLGQRLEMTLEGRTYMMEVVIPDSEECTEIFLIFVDTPPDGLNDRSRGSVRIYLEEAENVLYIPLSSLHQVETRAFVYVIEDGLRTIRDVEIGLKGDGLVEIISGLKEGELIIR